MLRLSLQGRKAVFDSKLFHDVATHLIQYELLNANHMVLDTD